MRAVPSPGRRRAVQLADLYRRAPARPRHGRVTTSRVMPPWKPEAGFGDFSGERRLTDAQILTIDRWVNTGLLEGDASDLPSMPHWSGGWQLGKPDLVVALPAYTLGADGSDVFRNFVVRVPGTGTRYVRGLEFRPGSGAVHHANIRIDETAASRRLDEADPEPGYEGAILHSADYPDGHFLGWTPGQAPPLAPNDMAWRLESGSDFVVQLHLRPTGKPERLQPAIGLYFATDRLHGRPQSCAWVVRTSTCRRASATIGSPIRTCSRWTQKSVRSSRTRTTEHAPSAPGRLPGGARRR